MHIAWEVVEIRKDRVLLQVVQLKDDLHTICGDKHTLTVTFTNKTAIKSLDGLKYLSTDYLETSINFLINNADQYV